MAISWPPSDDRLIRYATHSRGSLPMVALLSLFALSATLIPACGSQPARLAAVPATTTTTPTTTTTTTTTTVPTTTTLPVVSLPAGFDWQLSATSSSDGRPIMWTATDSSSGSALALAVFDRRAVRLVLHRGGSIPPDALPNVIAAFNGGFKLSGESGMLLGGSQNGAIADGMAAAVGYSDGGFDLGQWGRDIPAANRTVDWARSNLRLLVDGGQPNPSAGNPGAWGAVVKSVGWRTSRSAIGVTADGNLVWVGGMRVIPSTLADTLVAAGAVRAMQLDINPMWVAFFSFDAGQPSVVVPGQNRPASTYIAGWNRDFFTVERA